MADETEVETPVVESLDDVLSSAEPEKTEEATEEKPAETDKVETEDSTSESESTEDKSVPLAALLDERDKRQKIAKELEERDAKIAELSKQPETERPDVFEDQDGAFQHIEQMLNTARAEDRFALSRDFMSMLKDDYEDKEQAFMDIAKDTPSLREELWKSPNPARFAYETAVKHERLKELDNVDEVKDKMRAELREEVKAELQAELDQEQESTAKKRDAITPSLAKGRSTSGLETAEEDDLDDVLTNMG